MSTSVERGGLPMQARPIDGGVAVRTTNGGMEAQLTITPPKNGGQPLGFAQAMAALGRANVTYGIDTNAVEALVRDAAEASDDKARTVVVARGHGALCGEDATVSYHELLERPSGTPQQRADGSVDHFQLHLVRNVTAGTVLATRRPAGRGTPGINVHGQPVPGPDGREIPLRAGKGCRLSADGLSVVAEIGGHAVLTPDGRVSVSPTYTVDGDVDTATGHIDFVGTVIVLGGVKQGFVVKAGQNVEVHGGIDGGVVEAGGDVIVRYGIQGGLRGKVTAGGKIRSRFIENGDVTCAGALIVSDGILHSRVRCGGKVLVEGRRGSIIGGQVRAREEVQSRIIGSSLLTATEVEVGATPEARDELESVRRNLFEAEEGLRKALQAVNLLREMESRQPETFDEKQRSMLLKALRSQYHLHAQKEQLMARRAVLEEQLQSAHLGRVRAFDLVYPGVKITIGKQSVVVADAQQHVCFYLNDQHEMTTGPA